MAEDEEVTDMKEEHGESNIKNREENAVTEILSVLSDGVLRSIMRRIDETDTCTREDLMTMDAVVEEGESLVRNLREYGLIEVEKDTVVITEKGRKFLAFVEEMKMKK